MQFDKTDRRNIKDSKITEKSYENKDNMTQTNEQRQSTINKRKITALQFFIRVGWPKLLCKRGESKRLNLFL